MVKENQIIVLAAATQHTLQRNGADVEDIYFESLDDAKRRAKYLLTDQYQRESESSVRLGYSQVVMNGVVVADYFAKPPK